MNSQNLYAQENVVFNRNMLEKKCLVISHRGSFGGNIIENTSGAVSAAFMEGSDMVELDIIKSTDGVYYLFHDGNEKRLLGVDENIKTMSSSEIDALYYLNSISHKINTKVERLESFLQQLPSDCLINFDRSWFYWPDLFKIFDQYDVRQNIILKSPPLPETLATLENHPIKYMYFPIIKTEEEFQQLESYKHINLVGVEIIACTTDSPFFKKEKIQSYVNDGLMVLGNAITLDDDTILFPEFGDNRAICQGETHGWVPMLDMGITAIQTDWTALVVKTRNHYYQSVGVY